MSTKQKFLQEGGKVNLVNENEKPKVGERYEAILNNPEVHDQIIEAFDEDKLEIMGFDLAQKIAYEDIDYLRNKNSLNENAFGVKEGLGDIYLLLNGIHGNNSSKARDIREKIIYDKNADMHYKLHALRSASGISNEKVDKAFDFLFSFVKNESNSEKQKEYANSFIFYSAIEGRDGDKYMSMREELLDLGAHPWSVARTLQGCFSEKSMEMRKRLLAHGKDEISPIEIGDLIYSYTGIDTPELMQYRREIFDKIINIDYQLEWTNDLVDRVISSLGGIRSLEAQRLREEYYKKRPYYSILNKGYKRSIDEDMNYLSPEEGNKLIEKLFERFKKNPNYNTLSSFIFKLRGINTIRAQEIRNEIFEILNNMNFSKSDSDERIWLYRMLSQNISNKVKSKPMVFENIKNELFLPKIRGI